MDEAEFIKRLLATFKIEAEEHIKAISTGLLLLEKGPQGEERLQTIETIFREAHSLKGAARTVDLKAVESICQSLEDLFKGLKHGQISFSQTGFDVLLKALDLIEQSVAAGPGAQLPVAGLLRQLDGLRSSSRIEAAGHKKTPPAAPTFPDEKILASAPPTDMVRETVARFQPGPIAAQQFGATVQTPGETVRIPVKKLDRLLLQAEELILAKLYIQRRAAELKEIVPVLEQWEKRCAAGKPGPDKKTEEFLHWNQAQLKAVLAAIRGNAKALDHDQRILAGMIDAQLEDVKKVLTLPFSSLLEGFPKMVRDLSRQLGKEVDLLVQGGEVEIDKRILAEMKDPLLHLLRNAVDHGIERPDQRRKANKAARGTVVVTISQKESNLVEIRVSDDGAGIDLDQVRKKLMDAGLYSVEGMHVLSDQEIAESIFRSEFSTSPLITELSGRGLGLAIVKEKVEALHGKVEIHTVAGQGASFRLVLPLTLATARGVLVEAAERKFLIPTGLVRQVLRLRREGIKTVENRDTITVHEQVVSLVPLSRALQFSETTPKTTKPDFIQILVLGSEKTVLAFSVDRILDELEILVKSLGGPLVRVNNISGAAILGSGDVVPIINVADLLVSGARASAAGEGSLNAAGAGPAEQGSILLVEDSITSRMLLRTILEAAGYLVRVAKDGLEGWITLKEHGADLVVSDVDMPRLNGFELTAKIRQDQAFADTPVILVTGLESQEDQERGIEVGANAYIVKSRFDQSNLLATVRRLL